tara:strand:- start:38 stop:547 length:510 start_codon:yes stop_codon:yes gene_type:complete
MAPVKKMFNNMKTEHILGMIGLVFLVIGLYQYSQNKNLLQSGMTNNSSEIVKVSQPNKVTGHLLPSNHSKFNNQQVVNISPANPSDLLPKDSNNLWAQLNPPSSELQGKQLLNPDQVVGINTQGSSLRNANLQLRSEPPNPRNNTNCPWNISTIESDTQRKSLEIGSQN